MAIRRTSEEWTKIVESYKKSGQTISAWCEEHGINAKTMSAHVLSEGTVKQKVKRTAQEWGELIARQKRSGLGRSEWCRKHGVDSGLMARAERRQSTREQGTTDLTWIELGVENQPAIAPVKKEETRWGVRIRSNGLEIEVHTEYPAAKLAVLLERLVKSC